VAGSWLKRRSSYLRCRAVADLSLEAKHLLTPQAAYPNHSTFFNVEAAKGLFELRPIHGFGRLRKLLTLVELIAQLGQQKRILCWAG
jgi:hypothetical protein